MAAAYSSDDFDNDNTVEPKQNYKKIEISDDLRSKAFVPEQLPEDFLRVILNQQQLTESKDNALAKQLQYGYNYPKYDMNLYRRNEINFGRGKLQIDIAEAKLNKNYGFTKMDPYVRVKIASKIYETPTDYGGARNPRWRKTIMCYLPQNVDMISIEIFDEKSFTDDELIAFVQFPIPNLLFETGFYEAWLPLSGKLGEQKEGQIFIQLFFTPVANLHNANMMPLGLYQNIPVLNPQNSISSGSSSSSRTSPTSSNPPLIHTRVQLPPDPTISSVSRESNQNSTINTVQITQADLNSIKEMFPTFEEDVIKSILESKNGNKESTIEALLQMVTD